MHETVVTLFAGTGLTLASLSPTSLMMELIHTCWVNSFIGTIFWFLDVDIFIIRVMFLIFRSWISLMTSWSCKLLLPSKIPSSTYTMNMMSSQKKTQSSISDVWILWTWVCSQGMSSTRVQPVSGCRYSSLASKCDPWNSHAWFESLVAIPCKCPSQLELVDMP